MRHRYRPASSGIASQQGLIERLAAVYPASEYADWVHGTTLTADGGRLAV